MRTDAADLDRKMRRLTGRVLVIAVAIAIGVAVASLVPQLSEAVRAALGLGVAVPSGQEATDDAEKRRRDAAADDEVPAIVKLTDDQIRTAGIELAPVQDGTL